MRLLFVRHGQTTSNVDHLLDTCAPGADLTDLGRRQAQGVPGGVAREHIGALYVSNLVRTQQTAEPLARATGLEPRVREGIREIAAGEYEMRNDPEAVEGYLGTVFDWDTDLDRTIPGGESGRDVLERVDAVVAEAAREVGDGGTALMVAHGGVIRAWAAMRADNVDMTYASDHWLPNTGMVAFEGTPGDGWTVTCWTEEPLGGARSGTEETGPAGAPEEEAVDEAEHD